MISSPQVHHRMASTNMMFDIIYFVLCMQYVIYCMVLAATTLETRTGTLDILPTTQLFSSIDVYDA